MFCSIVYFLAAIPGSISMLFKERAIRSQPMDIYYLNGWVSFYQFLGGIFIAPVIFDIKVMFLPKLVNELQVITLFLKLDFTFGSKAKWISVFGNWNS